MKLAAVTIIGIGIVKISEGVGDIPGTEDAVVTNTWHEEGFQHWIIMASYILKTVTSIRIKLQNKNYYVKCIISLLVPSLN